MPVGLHGRSVPPDPPGGTPDSLDFEIDERYLLEVFGSVEQAEQFLRHQRKSCYEAQVAAHLETIDEGEADLAEPDYASTGASFPLPLITRRGRISEWEVGATAGFVLSVLRSYGSAGVSLGTLIAGYKRFGQISMEWNVRQQCRQERYICAIIDGLFTLRALRTEGTVTLNSVIMAYADVEEPSSPWQQTMSLIADTWLQSCYDKMVGDPTPTDCCLLSAVAQRLCSRLSRPPGL